LTYAIEFVIDTPKPMSYLTRLSVSKQGSTVGWPVSVELERTWTGRVVT